MAVRTAIAVASITALVLIWSVPSVARDVTAFVVPSGHRTCTTSTCSNNGDANVRTSLAGPTSTSNALPSAFFAGSTVQYRPPTATITPTTSLSMGLRSFIKRKLRKGDKADDGSKSSKKSNKKGKKNKKMTPSKPPIRDTLSSDVSAPSQPPLTANSGSAVPDTIVETFSAAQGSGGDQKKKKKKKIGRDQQVRSLDEPIRQKLPDAENDETVQQRIQRVKAGRMSNEEKEAFLATALSNPIPRAGDGRGGKPIRQALPDGQQSGGGEGGDGAAAGGGGGVTDVAAILANASKEQRSKRSDAAAAAASADTGTGGAGGVGGNPLLRGPLWSTVNANAPSATPTGKRSGSAAVEKLNEDEKKKFLDSVMNPERFRTYGVNGGVGMDSAYEAAAAEEENQWLSPTPTPTPEVEAKEEAVAADDETNGDGGGDDDDQTNEKKEKTKKKKGGIFAGAAGLADRLEAAAHAKEKEDREKRERAEEAERERMRMIEEEMRARELELQRKMEADIQRKKDEEERIRAEAEAAERAEKERLEALQRQQDEYWARQLDEEARRREERFTAEQRAERSEAEREEAEREKKEMERKAREEVERAIIREEERMRENPHESEILQEAQEDELHDREFTRAIMDDTAGLPARQPVEDVSSSAFVNEQQQKQAEIDRVKREQEERLRALSSPLPTPGSPARTIAPSPVPAMSTPSSAKSLAELSSLLNKQGNQGTGANAAPAPPPAPASPLPSLREMTRLKSNQTPPPPAPASPLPTLAEMTRLKKDNPGTSSVDKRVVRQQLPIGDEDDLDYDGDDYLRGGANTGMSIGDVMKNIGGETKGRGSDSSGGNQSDAEKKAMMWGIDMSKYNDLD